MKFDLVTNLPTTNCLIYIDKFRVIGAIIVIGGALYEMGTYEIGKPSGPLTGIGQVIAEILFPMPTELPIAQAPARGNIRSSENPEDWEKRIKELQQQRNGGGLNPQERTELDKEINKLKQKYKQYQKTLPEDDPNRRRHRE